MNIDIQERSDYNNRENFKHKFLLCIIDSTDRIHNDYVKEVSKNISEYWINEINHDMASVQCKIFASHSNAYEYVKKNHEELNVDWVICSEVGTDFNVHKEYFFSIFDRTIRDNDALYGHILDRKDNYYELHFQCYAYNLHVIKKLNFPFFGKEEDNHVMETEVPLRSSENHHHDYTPLWVTKNTSSTKLKEYTNLKHGWSLINEILREGYFIKSFTRELRDSKMYLYGVVKEEKLNKLIEYENKCINKNKNLFFSINTETLNFVDDLKEKKIKPIIQRAIAPAAGLNIFKLLYSTGYDKEELKVKIIDNSEFALYLYRKMWYEWDGYDYKQFLLDNTPIFLHKNVTQLLIRGSNFDKHWHKFLDHFGGPHSWQLWFRELKENIIDFSFDNFDYMEHTSKQRIEEVITSFYSSDLKGIQYLNLSNVFHYKPTRVYKNTHILQDLLDQLFEKFNKHDSMKNVFYTSCGPFCHPLATHYGYVNKYRYMLSHINYNWKV